MESYQCYLPKNPKTGQESQVLYSIGTSNHKHSASGVNWIDASGPRSVPDSEVEYKNWGKPIGWDEVSVHGRHCGKPHDEQGPGPGPEAPGCCIEYVAANQKATGFTWWDTEEFQKSQGSTKEDKHSGTIYQLTLRTYTVQDHIICYGNCCPWHSHVSDGEGGTICVGQSPPHRHSHTEYEVFKKTNVQLQHNFDTKQGTSDNKDHATNKSITRSGYGIHTKLNYNYSTDLKNPIGCCTWGAEAYTFMPHQNKELPHRIVEMDIANNAKPFPTAFQTAKNPKTLLKTRQQFIDVDYPDKDMKINLRYKLLAPGFTPTKYPTPTEIGLKNKYPNSNNALGNCNISTIRVEGNMWDDVWVHPDNPNGINR